jgi:hypothetical protein
MLAISSGVVVGVATVAVAEPVKDTKSLKESCAKGNGLYIPDTRGGGPEFGVCEVQGGMVWCADKKDGSSECHGVRTPKRTLVPTDTVRADNGVSLTTQGVSDLRVWKQKLSIPTLTDVVCSSLGGDVLASADARFGTCATSTATIVCKDGLPGTNCVGFADTKKQAKSIPKQIKTVVSGNAGGTSTTATATTEAPTTTRCVGRRCPKPTIPPGTKAPQPSVSVAPPK